MVRVVAINTGHLIDVIVLHRVDPLLDKGLVQLEPREVFRGVLVRDRLCFRLAVDGVARVLDKLAHFSHMLRGGRPHVPYIARYYALASHGRDHPVEE